MKASTEPSSPSRLRLWEPCRWSDQSHLSEETQPISDKLYLHSSQTNMTQQEILTIVSLLPPVEPSEHGIRQVHTDIWGRSGWNISVTCAELWGWMMNKILPLVSPQHLNTAAGFCRSEMGCITRCLFYCILWTFHWYGTLYVETGADSTSGSNTVWAVVSWRHFPAQLSSAAAVLSFPAGLTH